MLFCLHYFCIKQKQPAFFWQKLRLGYRKWNDYAKCQGFCKIISKSSGWLQVHWTAVYGSISFNQYGKEFPTGGMNEKGLVVELMWLDETKFPAQDKSLHLMCSNGYNTS